jgi:hypothetical protein
VLLPRDALEGADPWVISADLEDPGSLLPASTGLLPTSIGAFAIDPRHRQVLYLPTQDED